MKLALAIIAAVLTWLLTRGSYPRPWSPPGTGTRRQHRAGYSKEGFKI